MMVMDSYQDTIGPAWRRIIQASLQLISFSTLAVVVGLCLGLYMAPARAQVSPSERQIRAEMATKSVADSMDAIARRQEKQDARIEQMAQDMATMKGFGLGLGSLAVVLQFLGFVAPLIRRR